MFGKENSKILFGTKGSFAIAELVFNYPHSSFHLRDLAKKTHCSTTAITEGINLLEKYHVIKKEEGNVTTNIRANLESESYRYYKIVFNIYRLTRSLVIERLKEYFNNPECISIFGSFAKGEDTERSDIDVLIISPIEKQQSNDFKKFVTVIEKEFNRKVNLHVLKSLKDSSNSFKNAAANGIVLYGYLRVLE